MKKLIWGFWGLVSVSLGLYFAKQFLWAEDRSALLIGETSHGHFQIEMACTSCHTDAFGGPEVLQNACVGCHGAELELANDAHPKSKFTNPRNADRVAILDARYCVTCHTEHRAEANFAMGVTVPDDYCYYCHQDIFESRPSHEGMAFDSCASSGCHNFHDNRALYEDFLVEHSGQPSLLATRVLPALRALAITEAARPLTRAEADAPEQYLSGQAVADWSQTNHALKGTNCSGCHQEEKDSRAWIEQPGIEQCRSCHAFEAEGFVAGKHGMRLNPELMLNENLQAEFAGVKPADVGRLDFDPSSATREHGCNACHNAHSFDTASAAVESCLGCHADEHSLAYRQSPHGALWQAEQSSNAERGSGVSCATCHMPRQTHTRDGEQFVRVQHNQNANLRPNEKMLREVCMNCHGLAFSIDSLADTELIKSNFNGKPSFHVPSIDMAVERSRREQVKE